MNISTKHAITPSNFVLLPCITPLNVPEESLPRTSSGFQPNQGKNTAVVKIVSYDRCLQTISVYFTAKVLSCFGYFFTNFVANFVKFFQIPTFSLIKTNFFICSVVLSMANQVYSDIWPQNCFLRPFLLKNF